MLRSLASRPASSLSLAGRVAIRATTASRTIRSSATVLSGAGHGHHDEPQPPFIPRPAIGERNFFGELKQPRISKDEGYKPGKSDVYSFIGAFAFVGLTVAAVTMFSLKETKKGGHPAPKHEETKEVKKHHHHHAEKEALKPVVEKKLLIAPVDVTPPAAEAQEKTPASASSNSEPATAAEEEKKESATAEAEAKLPESVPYLLIGGGAASYYAALAIRARQADAKVLIISDEEHLPYNRPPLSKELWWYGGERSREHLEYKMPSGRTRDVFFEAEGFYVPPSDLTSAAHGGVSIACGKKVVRVDAVAKKAYLDDGTAIGFQQCLIATGGRPKPLPELEDAAEGVRQRVLYYRKLNDFRRLDEAAASSKSITVIGGGLLGAELAYSLKRRYKDLEVHQVIPDRGQLSAVLPEYLSLHANLEMRKAGVDVVAESRLRAADADKDGRITLSLESVATGESRTLHTDCVVVATGILPNVDIATASDLPVDEANGGILADAELRVTGNVYAAGDAASFQDPQFGRRRLEHYEHAQISGRLAGMNMTGGAKSFWYQPSFFTKLAPTLLLNAVGETDSKLETVSVYARTEESDVEHKFGRGVVFYVRDKKVVGVITVNLATGLDVSRRIIDDGKEVEDFKELARLFPVYENDEEEEKRKENGEEPAKEEKKRQ